MVYYMCIKPSDKDLPNKQGVEIAFNERYTQQQILALT